MLGRKVELLPIIHLSLRQLRAELRVAQKVLRVSHLDLLLLILRQSEELGYVIDQGRYQGIGNGMVGEVEEADVDERVSQLVDELLACLGRGDKPVVEDGNAREVGRGRHGGMRKRSVSVDDPTMYICLSLWNLD